MTHPLFNDLVTLIVVVNPIGLVPLFIAVAGQESIIRRRQLALHAVLIAAVILFAFIAVGQIMLEALGIELSSFQLAGGLVLLIIALRMVLQDTQVPAREVASDLRNIAVFPLAMPFIAGPATIMAVVLLTDNNVYTVWQQLETAVVLLVVLALAYACMIGADFVQRVLGLTGANVVSRIMGLILAALAIQAIIAGLRGLKLVTAP